MHYMPAALIGEFGADATTKRRTRERQVWVARRGVDTPFRATAQNVGYDPANPRMYEGAQSNIDEIWQRAERGHQGVQLLTRGIAETGVVPASAFANVLAPYTAHLIARHPSLALDDGLSELSSGSETREHDLHLRYQTFARLADAFLTQRKWSLLTAPAGVTLINNDIGWQYVPGRVPGEAFIPINPHTAFVIRGGERSYDPHSDWVSIPGVEWEAWMVELRRDAVASAGVVCDYRRVIRLDSRR
jgi:hypothetical protein